MKPLLSEHLRDLLARLSSLAQIGELARRLVSAQKSFVKVAQCLLTIKFKRLRLWTKDIDLTHQGQFLTPDKQIRTNCS